MSYTRIPPNGCTCDSYWTTRHAHKPDCPVILARRRPDSHLIHRTKDIFDSQCSYCRKAAKIRRTHWEAGLL